MFVQSVVNLVSDTTDGIGEHRLHPALHGTSVVSGAKWLRCQQGSAMQLPGSSRHRVAIAPQRKPGLEVLRIDDSTASIIWIVDDLMSESQPDSLVCEGTADAIE